MKNKFLVLIMLLLTLIACNDYVTNLDPLMSDTEDENLDAKGEIPFLIRGIKHQLSRTVDELFMAADGLSDETYFNYHVPSATYPSFDKIDKGYIQFDNNSVRRPYTSLGRARLFADTLIVRIGRIKFTDKGEDKKLKNEGLYIANLYSGITHYFYATYFGLNEKEGGGAINNSPFIPSAKMYELAIGKFIEALKYTTDAKRERMLNTLIAKAYLYAEKYAEALPYAEKGMVAGDSPMDILFSTEAGNRYYYQAGDYRPQYVVDARFLKYIEDDPNEALRIKLKAIKGTDGNIYYYQMKYPVQESPITFITWQENNLIKAELALRGQGSGDALALVNEIRTSHKSETKQLAPLNSVDLDVIYVERDKELFVSGNRLADQRRFKKWHLADGTWQYLPIPDDERNNNPHF